MTSILSDGTLYHAKDDLLPLKTIAQRTYEDIDKLKNRLNNFKKNRINRNTKIKWNRK